MVSRRQMFAWGLITATVTTAGGAFAQAFPTKPMEKEAAAAGFFETPFEKVPRIQIITLAELFQGKRPRIPRIDSAATFNAAAREKTDRQTEMF